ncbi:Major Facilitator Superfamily protein [Pseudovibrio sp. W64]|uniref:MFS transporter n=1 Tax=Pseudovibrio sp. W64 TaxID=1735583 RepID=UPI0007AEA525|nr:MFS transporter [Pseudovibrio sp. W64]KZK78374.1 Major Facilitator Superfamily protein [Pseudovibrio sp. W64]
MKLSVLVFANFIASIAMGIALTIVPWELSRSLGGEKVLAFTATYATALLIFLAPVSGRVVDRFSRRSTLMICIAIMAGVLQIASVAYGNSFLKIASLSTFYFASQVFFLFFYNALTAFIQEVFAEGERGKVNGWMQVEMQASTFVVGLLMIYAVNSNDFQFLLQLNSGLMLLSALLFCFIPYTQQARPARARVSRTVFRSIFKRKDLVLLGVCANITFVAVMMLNLVHPIYLSGVLKLDVSALAKLSISYGLGAALSGFLISRFVSTGSAIRIMRICLTVFSLALLTISLFPTLPTIVIGMGILGAMGSANRVAFNTYVMSKVEKDIFGSYLSVISSLTYVQRTLFGFLLSLLIVGFPASNYYWFVFAISCFGLLLLQIHAVLASTQKLELSETIEVN